MNIDRLRKLAGLQLNEASNKLANREEIIKWLDSMGIEKYKVNADLTVDTKASVSLLNKKLDIIPVQFGIVDGDFRVDGNNLKSLAGAPKKVGGGFYALRNKLTSLKGAPKTVGGVFDVSYNKLTDLTDSPQIVGYNFNITNNKLTSLKGAPKTVGGDFNVSDNNKFKPDEDALKTKITNKLKWNMK